MSPHFPKLISSSINVTLRVPNNMTASCLMLRLLHMQWTTRIEQTQTAPVSAASGGKSNATELTRHHAVKSKNNCARCGDFVRHDGDHLIGHRQGARVLFHWPCVLARIHENDQRNAKSAAASPEVGQPRASPIEQLPGFSDRRGGHLRPDRGAGAVLSKSH